MVKTPNRFAQVQRKDVPEPRLRTEVQVTCPCDVVVEFQIVESDGVHHGRLLRECMDCNYVEVGRLVRPATKPDPES